MKYLVLVLSLLVSSMAHATYDEQKAKLLMIFSPADKAASSELVNNVTRTIVWTDFDTMKACQNAMWILLNPKTTYLPDLGPELGAGQLLDLEHNQVARNQIVYTYRCIPAGPATVGYPSSY